MDRSFRRTAAAACLVIAGSVAVILASWRAPATPFNPDEAADGSWEVSCGVRSEGDRVVFEIEPARDLTCECVMAHDSFSCRCRRVT